jgi:hypothetical protein
MKFDIRDRMLGVIVTMVSSAIMFLVYNYVGSFETKANSDKKFDVVNKKLDMVICYLDKAKCLNHNR